MSRGGNCLRHGQLGPKFRFCEVNPTKSRIGEQESRPNHRCHGKAKGQTAGHTHTHMWRSKEGLTRLGTRGRSVHKSERDKCGGREDKGYDISH